MARVHCVDCGIDVAVDPLGQCPEGHLLPATGTRVSTAIGSDEPHPDEPVPWVGQVVLEEPTEAVVTERTAQPSVAPGLDPAERETVPGDLLRELGDLSNEDGPGASSPAPSTPPPGAPPAPRTPSAMAMATAAAPAPASNGHAAPNSHAAANGHAAPNGHAATAGDLSEFSALEQAIQSLESGSKRAEAPTAPAAPAPELDDDLGRLFDDLDGEGDTSPAPAAEAPAAEPVPAPAPPPRTASPQPQHQALADAAEQVAASGDRHSPPEAAAPETPAPPPPARPTIDTMNFTAKGGPTKGRRRRLLGR